MKKLYSYLALILFSLPIYAQETIIIGEFPAKQQQEVRFSGKVLDEADQPIPGAVLHLQPIDKHEVSDAQGFFEFKVREGSYSLSISSLGYEELTVNIELRNTGTYDFQLSERAIDLSEVTVKDSRKDDNITEVIGGVEQMNVEQLQQQSKFLGEMDVLRSLQSVTGVTSAGEGSSGFNVRGGNTDENLILMEGNLLFNPVHALGFFSTFHPDMVQNVTLYKGGVPAKYGGRLSSVLDVELREGNDQRIAGQGGLGIASSRFVLEGPIVKNKASFIIGGRASYADWILKRTSNVDLQKSDAFFYDLNLKVDARLTESTRFGLTAFTTDDNFQFADEVKFDYSTTSGAAYIKQLIGQNINLTAQINKGQYTSNLYDINGNDQSKFTNQIDYLRGSLSAFFQIGKNYQLDLGMEQNRYTIAPGQLTPLENSVVKADILPSEEGIETSYFVNNQWTFGEKLELMAGIRYTQFKNVGPKSVLIYEAGTPKTVESIQDSLQFNDGQAIAEYSGFEPRVSLRFSFTKSSSVKLGYNRSYQFLSQISNTASATPIDIWQLSNYHIKPQQADNFSIGYYQNFRDNSIQSYLSVFYRKIDNLIDYKDFARLLLNPHIETELVTGQGKAYGIEFYFKKGYGQHRFELNYTYSRTLRQIEESEAQEAVNRGEWYPSNFDKPHSLNLNYLFEITPKSKLSVNFTYSTGRPTTAPISSFSNSNVLTIPVYSDRNQYRIPDYHRMDVAYTIGPWGKSERWRNSLTLSIYNLYFRKNAFSVFFRQNPFQSVTAYRVAVLGSMFPAITYDFKF